MRRALSGLARRTLLTGGSAAALFGATGCTISGPTSYPNGRYRFTMPEGRSIHEVLSELTSILGPTRQEHIEDRGRPGLDAGDLVTVKAPPARDNRTARWLSEQVRRQLKLADFEDDFELAVQSEWIGMCRTDPETIVGGSDVACVDTHGAPNDFAWALRSMNVPDAWAWSIESNRPAYGKGIVIGHIDTGIAPHVELGDEVLADAGYDFIAGKAGAVDPLELTPHLEQIGHGTATASVIVSRGGVGNWPARGFCGGTTGPGRITGTAPQARIWPARAFRFAATAARERTADAIDYLRKCNVDIITMALGWPLPSDVLAEQVRLAVKENILVLAAAGNMYREVVYPARYAETIAIAGIGPDDEVWCGSARGSKVAVSAPGDKVWRAFRRENDPTLDAISPRFGTSFAASLTAGVAALWLAHHGRDALIQQTKANGRHADLQSVFRTALSATARRPPGWPRHGGRFGAGVVNANNLLRADVASYV